MDKRRQNNPNTETFRFFNMNPKDKYTTDCVIRAISLGRECSYKRVLLELCELQMETGYDMSDAKCYGKYLEQNGWKKQKQPRKWNNKKYTGVEFCDMLNNDSYMTEKNIIAHIGGNHIVCIMEHDGKFKVHDTWDSTDGCIGNYWIRS